MTNFIELIKLFGVGGRPCRRDWLGLRYSSARKRKRRKKRGFFSCFSLPGIFSCSIFVRRPGSYTAVLYIDKRPRSAPAALRGPFFVWNFSIKREEKYIFDKKKYRADTGTGNGGFNGDLAIAFMRNPT